jgi:small acid-soluble spore protein H (minor)
MIILDEKRLLEILESHGIINVTYNSNPVWLEGISNNKDGVIQVKDLKTDEIMLVDIRELKE